jgi:hypothetical protein
MLEPPQGTIDYMHSMFGSRHGQQCNPRFDDYWMMYCPKSFNSEPQAKASRRITCAFGYGLNEPVTIDLQS